MTTYRIVINIIQTFQEVIEVDASNVQRARSRARAEIDSLWSSRTWLTRTIGSTPSRGRNPQLLQKEC